MSATSKRLRSQATQQLTSTTKSIAKSTSSIKSSIAGGRQTPVTGPAKLPITPNKPSRSPSAAHTKTKPGISAGAASRLPRPAASRPSLPGLPKRQPPAGSKPVRCSKKLLPTDVPAASQAVNSAPAPDKRALGNNSAEDEAPVSLPQLPSLQDLRKELQVSRQCLSAGDARWEEPFDMLHLFDMQLCATPTCEQWICTPACLALMLPLLRHLCAMVCAMPSCCFCQEKPLHWSAALSTCRHKQMACPTRSCCQSSWLIHPFMQAGQW